MEYISLLYRFFKRFNLLFLFLLLLFFAHFSGVTLVEIFLKIKKITASQLIILIIGYFVISFFIIHGKIFLLSSFGYKISYCSMSLVHFASISANYSTPVKIGYPITTYLLKKISNIPLSISSAMILLELGITVLFSGFVGVVGSLLFFSEKLHFFYSSLVFFIFITLISIIFLFLYVFRRMLRQNKVFENFTTSLRMLTLEQIVRYFLIQFLIQGVSASYLMLLLFFLDSYIGLWHAFIANSSAFFIGAISMVPMGIGTRDMSMVYYLNGFGVPIQTSLFAASLQRVLVTGIGLLTGLIASFLLGFSTVAKK